MGRGSSQALVPSKDCICQAKGYLLSPRQRQKTLAPVSRILIGRPVGLQVWAPHPLVQW